MLGRIRISVGIMRYDMKDEEHVAIPKEEFDILLTRATIELLQRVNRLVELLEKEKGLL
jgi:hypothetical protein